MEAKVHRDRDPPPYATGRAADPGSRSVLPRYSFLPSRLLAVVLRVLRVPFTGSAVSLAARRRNRPLRFTRCCCTFDFTRRSFSYRTMLKISRYSLCTVKSNGVDKISVRKIFYAEVAIPRTVRGALKADLW